MRGLFLLLAFLLSRPSLAQPVDSVIVEGRIRHMTARLYRESPTVFVSRNNILQDSRELVRPAPLNADGTFRVALPLIYPQEELYLTYGRISTAFLAAPGTLSIDVDADSLFTAAIPFQFGGVNAQVNTQFARYKAFEAALLNKPDNKKLSEQVSDKTASDTYQIVYTAYQFPFRQYATRQTPFALVSRWIQSINRYNAAAFVYDKAVYEGSRIPVSLDDSLRPPDDRLLTAARTSAMNRFAGYANQSASPESSQSGKGLSVRTLSTLLLRYGRNLTDEERSRLTDYVDKNSVKASDLRFFDRLVKRSNDTIQRLVNYETAIQRNQSWFDSAAVQYLTAHALASVLPGLTLDFAKLLYSYARPKVTDPRLSRSLDELYRLEVKDSTRVRATVQTLQKAGDNVTALDVASGVFITRNGQMAGSALFDQVVNANRGKVIYVLLTSAEDEVHRQAALNAQRLRSTYRSRDFALLYIPVPGTEPTLWAEFAAKNNLTGDHLLVTVDQLSDVLQRLRPDDSLSATVINRVGKIAKRNAPLPGAFEEVRKVVEKSL